MPGFSFYATRNDLYNLFKFLFTEFNIHVFEDLSAFNTRLHEYSGIEEIDSLTGLGKADSLTYFNLWSQEIMSGLYVKKMEYGPDASGADCFRYKLEGGGLIQIFCGGTLTQEQNCLIPSRFQYLTPGEAKKWGSSDGVNWNFLARYARQTRRHINRKMTVATINGLPILPEAMKYIESGYALKECLHSKSIFLPSDIIFM